MFPRRCCLTFAWIAAALGLVGGNLPHGEAQEAGGYFLAISDRRKAIFDVRRNQVHVTTGSGRLLTYDLATGNRLAERSFGVTLLGGDISSDGSYILLGQSVVTGSTQAIFRLDPDSGVVTTFTFPSLFQESGISDISIANDSFAFVATLFDGSGATPLRSINPTTGAVTRLTGFPASGSNPPDVLSNVVVQRSHDRTRFQFIETNTSTGNEFTYSATTGTYGSNVFSDFLISHGAVSRDGALTATRLGLPGTARPYYVTIERTPNFEPLRFVALTAAGMAFDATRDSLYLADADAIAVRELDVFTGAERRVMRVGSRSVFSRGPVFGEGSLSGSPDGKWLALNVRDGLRLIQTGGTLVDPPTDAGSHLVNVSTRVATGTGDAVCIGGFVIRGGSKRVLVRALGPSLGAAGVAGALVDPTLTLYNSQGSPIERNSDWATTQLGEDQTAAVRATGLAPPDSRESVIITTLPEGAYTAIVLGSAGTTGVCLVEVYDLEPSSTARIVNLSTRARVGMGDALMIGGFVLQGTEPRRVVVRAISASLYQSGVINVLNNMLLEIRDAQGGLVASNRSWELLPNSAELVNLGLAPSSNLECAALLTLPPGAYTALVRGLFGSTGIALVEVYELP